MYYVINFIYVIIIFILIIIINDNYYCYFVFYVVICRIMCTYCGIYDIRLVFVSTYFL